MPALGRGSGEGQEGFGEERRRSKQRLCVMATRGSRAGVCKEGSEGKKRNAGARTWKWRGTRRGRRRKEEKQAAIAWDGNKRGRSLG